MRGKVMAGFHDLLDRVGIVLGAAFSVQVSNITVTETAIFLPFGQVLLGKVF